MKIKYLFISLAFLTVTLSGCNTVPTSSSSSSSSPPPSSSGSTSSPSASSSQDSQSPASAGQESGEGQQNSASRGDTAGQADTGAGSDTGTGEKSEDEILAEALGEFEKGLQRQGPGEQGGNESGPAAGQVANGGGSDQPAMTDEEKARILEARLDDRFSKFDKQMLGERERVTSEENETGGGGGSYDEGDGGGTGYGDDPLQTAMNEPSLPPGGHSGFPGDKQTESVSQPPPPDVGDGRDDDIIARQLREAAQKEKDPELRAKLWEEYRKYKKGG